MSPMIDIYSHIFPERYFQEMTRVAPNLENIGKQQPPPPQQCTLGILCGLTG